MRHIIATVLALSFGLLSAAASAAPRTIYLNRHGGHYELDADVDDSRSNTTSVLEQTADLSPFLYGDEEWQGVVDCMRELFAPYDLEITDIDPGDAPHIEAVIAGTAEEAGFTDTQGIAPHTCDGVIDNAIVYAFAYDIGDDPQELCETAAQEIAHAFTLDHELDCRDPMTYLDGCGPKVFLDEDIACGEDTPRECWCGGTTQNSHQLLLAMAGESEAPDAGGCRVAGSPPAASAPAGLIGLAFLGWLGLRWAGSRRRGRDHTYRRY